MQGRAEYFRYFEDIYHNDYLYIYNIGYFDYRIRKYTEDKRNLYSSNATFHFVTGGKGTLVIEGKSYAVTEGDVFSMPAYRNYTFYPDEGDPWRYYWFNVVGNGVKELLSRMGINDKNPVIHTEKMPAIKQKLDELLDSEFNYGEFYYRALSTLYYLISYFVNEGDVAPMHADRKTIVSRAKEIIFTQYRNEGFSVCDIAKQVHISEPYLRKIFKRATGKTLSAFLINHRLSKAADLLHSADYSIRELCYLTGYSDDVYFVREFKKKYGVPPKKYRRLVLLKEL